MFTEKKTVLMKPTTAGKKQSKGEASAFLKAASEKSAETLSENGALKYSTTNNDFVDQFGSLGLYRSIRPFKDIAADMSTIYVQDPETAIKFVVYLRMITRVVQLPEGSNTESTQRGAGLRHESIMRMIWLHLFHKDQFWENIHIFLAAGSWHDIFTMLAYDLQYNGWAERVLDWDKFGKLILGGLEGAQSELVKKYLPTIKTRAKCTTLRAQARTLIGKWLCHLLFSENGNEIGPSEYKKYRKLKANGKAHEWQQLISQSKFLEIDFDSVHGRALSLLVSSQFLKNNKLEEKFEKWIDSKPVAKFTGYPHELFAKYGKIDSRGGIDITKLRVPQIKALNKQFDGLVATAKEGAKKDTALIVVRDTSASMNGRVDSLPCSAGDIAKSLALFFSEMLPEGAFAESWIEFSRDAKLHTWKGAGAYEKWCNDHSSYIGNTNFQSVIQLFCTIKGKGIPEEEFPTGILCLSDGEFDPYDLSEPNVDTARRKLVQAGFTPEYAENFKIVLWNLPNNWYSGSDVKFETADSEVANTFYFSGYDGSTIAFLTGLDTPDKRDKPEPKNAKELFEAAMDQELLNLVSCSE